MVTQLQKCPETLYLLDFRQFSEQLQMSYNELHYQLQTNDFSKIVHV